MKKLCITLLFLAAAGNVFSQYSRAQEEAFKKKKLNVLYARVGYGLCNFAPGKNTDASTGGRNELNYNNFKSQSCVFGGAGIEWALSHSVYIAGSLNFGHYNSAFNINGDGHGIITATYTAAQWLYNGSGKINYLALQAPVTVRFYIIKNFFVGAGPVLNVILKNNSTRTYSQTSYTASASDSLLSVSNYNENVNLTGGAPGVCAELGNKLLLKNYDLSFVFTYSRMANILAYDQRVYYNLNGNLYSLAVNFYPHLWGDRAKR